MIEITEKLSLVLDSKTKIAEGPIWDSEKQLFYWIDILEKTFNTFNPATAKNIEIKLPKLVGAVIPVQGEDFIAALEDGIYWLREKTAELEFICNPAENNANLRFNDAKCDKVGRLWVGTMDLAEEKPLGSVYKLDNQLKLTEQISGVTVSNGIIWNSDYQKMYYIDSPSEKVVVYNYNLAKGEISKPEVFISFADQPGIPDGMTIDSQDRLWIAHFGGGQVSCWDSKTGKQIGAVDLPVSNVTSCVFAGPDLEQLYITTARVGLSKEQLQKQPLAGGIFSYQSAVKGTTLNKFRVEL
jgi:sugar lactone lactonase YvrE